MIFQELKQQNSLVREVRFFFQLAQKLAQEMSKTVHFFTISFFCRLFHEWLLSFYCLSFSVSCPRCIIETDQHTSHLSWP